MTLHSHRTKESLVTEKRLCRRCRNWLTLQFFPTVVRTWIAARVGLETTRSYPSSYCRSCTTELLVERRRRTNTTVHASEGGRVFCGTRSASPSISSARDEVTCGTCLRKKRGRALKESIRES